MVETLGASAARKVTSHQHRVVAEAIMSCTGNPLRVTGDGLLAFWTFDQPVAALRGTRKAQTIYAMFDEPLSDFMTNTWTPALRGFFSGESVRQLNLSATPRTASGAISTKPTEAERSSDLTSLLVQSIKQRPLHDVETLVEFVQRASQVEPRLSSLARIFNACIYRLKEGLQE